jgi:hypothetical protein
MAYIYPCESPVELAVTMVISDVPCPPYVKEMNSGPKKSVGTATTGGHEDRTSRPSPEDKESSPFEVDKGKASPGNS